MADSDIKGPVNGIPITNDDKVAVSFDATVAFANGLPRDSNGRIAINGTTVTVGDGLSLDSDTLNVDSTVVRYGSPTTDVTISGTFTAGDIIAGNPGTESNGINVGGTTYTDKLKVSDVDDDTTVLANFHKHATGAGFGATLVLSRSNSEGSPATHAALVANQIIGGVFAVGRGTTSYQRSAEIQFVAEDTFADSDAPGRIVFFTSSDSSATPTERMRIDSTSDVIIGSGSPVTVNDFEVNATTITLNGKASVQPSVAGSAFFNIGEGTTPSSPVDGDVWAVGSPHGLFVQLGGVTYSITLTAV